MLAFENILLVGYALTCYSDFELERLDSKLFFAIRQVRSVVQLSSSELNVLVTVFLGLNLTIIGVIVTLMVLFF